MTGADCPFVHDMLYVKTDVSLVAFLFTTVAAAVVPTAASAVVILFGCPSLLIHDLLGLEGL